MTLSTAADTRRDTGRDHVAALSAVVEDLAGQFDLHPLLERILQHAADLLGCDSGSICTVDQSAGTYRKEVDLGVACRSGARFPLTEGVTGEILRAGGPVTFAEYADVRGGHIAAAERAQLHATIGVPIRWSGSVIGTCIVFSRDRARTFGPDDVTLLELFASHAGLAMVNARLHAQAAELTRAEAAGLERERVVRDVHDSVARALASVVLHLDSAELPTGTASVGTASVGTASVGTASVGTASVGTASVGTDMPRPESHEVGGDVRGADVLAPPGALDLARRAAWHALRETGRPLPPGRAAPGSPSHHWRPGETPVRPEADLVSRLRSEVDAARRTGLDIRLVVAGSPRGLTATIAEELRTVASRAIANILVHADARSARVGLVYAAAEVVLFVQDDGVGFDACARPRPDGSGLGLRGPAEDQLSDIMSLTGHLGGRVQVDTTPGWGTTVRAAIPYSAAGPGETTVGARRLRALVVEHRPLVAAGVAAVLHGDDQRIHVVGQTVGTADTMAAIGVLGPDVVLVDVALPAGAAALTARIRTANDSVAVLALGERDTFEPAVKDSISAGADGVVFLDADGADFREAVVRSAANGTVGHRPAGRPAAVSPPLRAPDALTPREREVRALVSRGMPDKKIAAALNISVKTVEKHVGAALRKTGARNRTELAALDRSGAPPG